MRKILPLFIILSLSLTACKDPALGVVIFRNRTAVDVRVLISDGTTERPFTLRPRQETSLVVEEFNHDNGPLEVINESLGLTGVTQIQMIFDGETSLDYDANTSLTVNNPVLEGGYTELRFDGVRSQFVYEISEEHVIASN